MDHLLVDVLLVGIAVFTVIMGVMRGFILSVLNFLKLFLSMGAAYLFGGVLGDWIGGFVKEPTPSRLMIARLSGYLAVFVLSLIGLTVAYYWIKAIKEKIPLLNAADKILGGVLGAVIACSTLFLIASVIRFFFETRDFYTESVILRAFGECQIDFLNLNEWIRSIPIG